MGITYDPPGEVPPLLTDMIVFFHSLASEGEQTPSPPEGASPPPYDNDGEPIAYRIRFKPDSQIFLKGMETVQALL